MPELPEVETIRRDLESRLMGKKITNVELRKSKVIRGNQRTLCSALIGNRITAIERVGKLLIFRLATGYYILIHLKMTGQLFFSHHKKIMARGGHSLSAGIDSTLPNKYTHATITFADGGRLFFNDMRLFAFFQLVNEKQKQAIISTYGIEPLTQNFTFERFAKIFYRRKTSLKAVLLNQKLIAGIGNIYADEICFAARIRPSRSAARLTKDDIRRLFNSAQGVIERAIAARGTTFNSYVDGEGRKGNFIAQLCVYGRAGEDCTSCVEKLKKARVAGRGTVYCSLCQK